MYVCCTIYKAYIWWSPIVRPHYRQQLTSPDLEYVCLLRISVWLLSLLIAPMGKLLSNKKVDFFQSITLSPPYRNFVLEI
jgi:hypothetical protein